MSSFKKIHNPYIIAEVGVNHECSISKAKKMIFSAAKAGASAVKFQYYKAEKITSKKSPAYWDLNKEKITSQYKLFKKYDKFENSDYVKLSNYCKKLKIDFMCTPFDLEAVVFLKKLVKYFKISSSDITNYPLLSAVAKTKKPIILSTGASNINEIKNSVSFLRHNGVKDSSIAILHCVLSYPTKDVDANLQIIDLLKKKFPKNYIGYSDHTMPDYGMTSLVSAFLKGACILEKHYTHNKKLKGNDHYHSMDMHDLEKFNFILSQINKKSKFKISNDRKILSCEKKSRKYARRSLYSRGKINKGDTFNSSNVIAKRPGNGISPIYFKKLIGKKSKVFIDDDELISFNKHVKR